MAAKSIPISVRITPEDAAFLAQLTIDGANSPSEKVRGLIAQARAQESSRRTYPESVAFLRATSAGTRKALDEAERRLDVHSELIHRIIDWLPEAMARLNSAWTEGEDGSVSSVTPREPEIEDLERLERHLVDRVMLLFEGLMRLAVTKTSPAYDPHVVDERLDSVIELADIIRQRREG